MGMANVQVVGVPGPEHLDQAIGAYIVQGFTIANRTPYSVTMVKPRKFEPLWAIVGLVLCLVPLLVYLIVYATQSDQVVEIRVVPPTASATPQLHLSPDGQAWWDGASWVSVNEAVPDGAPRSPDGAAWWDGLQWRPMPEGRLGA